MVNLELTEEGLRTAEVVPHVLAEVLNAMLAGFTEDEVKQLKNYLQRLLDNSRQLRGGDTAKI